MKAHARNYLVIGEAYKGAGWAVHLYGPHLIASDFATKREAEAYARRVRAALRGAK